MAAKAPSDIKHVIQISTDSPRGCEHCDELRRSVWVFDRAVNHYIEAHGYTLLHVGQESGSGSDGLYHYTVAVVGR